MEEVTYKKGALTGETRSLHGVPAVPANSWKREALTIARVHRAEPKDELKPGMVISIGKKGLYF